MATYPSIYTIDGFTRFLLQTYHVCAMCCVLTNLDHKLGDCFFDNWGYFPYVFEEPDPWDPRKIFRIDSWPSYEKYMNARKQRAASIKNFLLYNVYDQITSHCDVPQWTGYQNKSQPSYQEFSPAAARASSSFAYNPSLVAPQRPFDYNRVQAHNAYQPATPSVDDYSYGQPYYSSLSAMTWSGGYGQPLDTPVLGNSHTQNEQYSVRGNNFADDANDSNNYMYSDGPSSGSGCWDQEFAGHSTQQTLPEQRPGDPHSYSETRYTTGQTSSSSASSAVSPDVKANVASHATANKGKRKQDDDDAPSFEDDVQQKKPRVVKPLPSAPKAELKASASTAASSSSSTLITTTGKRRGPGRPPKNEVTANEKMAAGFSTFKVEGPMYRREMKKSAAR